MFHRFQPTSRRLIVTCFFLFFEKEKLVIDGWFFFPSWILIGIWLFIWWSNEGSINFNEFLFVLNIDGLILFFVRGLFRFTISFYGAMFRQLRSWTIFYHALVIILGYFLFLHTSPNLIHLKPKRSSVRF